MSEKFSLKWNDFHSNVSKSFEILRTEDYLQDVTLVGDDDCQVKAHKLVLSACSSYFKRIFTKNMNSNILLCLEGTDQTDLKNILFSRKRDLFRDKFKYTGCSKNFAVFVTPRRHYKLQ